ncbi:hypothetical protein CU254_34975 [Amycolatopsis sp. AA4]|nr:hypothetical protein CU254_34975 [Amycolatopsis sp. AA4]
MALGAWDAPNATLGASDAPNVALGRLVPRCQLASGQARGVPDTVWASMRGKSPAPASLAQLS